MREAARVANAVSPPQLHLRTIIGTVLSGDGNPIRDSDRRTTDIHLPPEYRTGWLR